MRQYEQLWRQLSERRRHAGGQLAVAEKLPSGSSPSRLDPYDLFSSYPTRVLSDEMTVMLAQPVDQTLYERTTALGVHKYALAILPTWAQVQALLAQLGASPVQVQALYGQSDPAQRKLLRRHILWMVKIGWLTLAM